MLVEALCQPGDVVIDCTTSTSNYNLPLSLCCDEAKTGLLFMYWVSKIFLLTCAGATIHACQATQHHILAFEEDKAIFDALFVPMMRKAVVSQPPQVLAAPAAGNMDEDDVVIERIKKTSRFSM